MQKQQKKKKQLDKSKGFDKSKKISWKRKRRFHLAFLQKTIKNSGRPFFNVTLHSLQKKNYLRADISLFSNNVFCSLKNIAQNKLICKASSGKYNIKVSKKSLKYASKLIITNFFKELKQKKVSLSKPLVLVLLAPSNLKKRILLTVLKFLKYIKNRRLIIYVKPKKIFNGCRAKKQIRKKQKRYAIYK